MSHTLAPTEHPFLANQIRHMFATIEPEAETASHSTSRFSLESLAHNPLQRRALILAASAVGFLLGASAVMAIR